MALFRTLTRPKEARDTGFTKFLDIGVSRASSGVAVSQDTALNLPVVYRCLALNSETIGALPVDVFTRVGVNRKEVERPQWMVQPNDAQDWQAFATMVQLSIEMDGNAFILKGMSDGSIDQLYVLNPTAVTIVRRRLSDGTSFVTYDVHQDGGKTQTFLADQIVHIPGLTRPGEVRGLSPIALLRESIGVGMAAQEFGGRFFGSGATLSGVVEVPGTLTAESAERLKETFARKHAGLQKSHAIGVLTGGATFTPFSVKPEEAQFIETSRVTAVTIALAFGVPPNYAVDAEGTKGYVTGVAASKMMWLQTGLLTRITRLEGAFSALLPELRYVKFNLRGFLRGDPAEESQYLSAQKDRGIINANEWRSLLDLNPIEGGEMYLNTLANFLDPATPVEEEVPSE